MRVERVTGERAFEEFVALSPQPSEMLRTRLDTSREPFWWSASRELYLLRDGRKAVGRIGAVRSHAYDEAYVDRAGFFAWLQAPDDLGGVRALIEAASHTLRGWDRKLIRGPMHLGLGEDFGMLTAGFDESRVSLAPWNPPYLPGHLEALGFDVVHERHGYHWSREEMPPPPSSLRTYGAKEGEIRGVTYRPLDHERPEQEVRRFVATFNAAYQSRYGFVPMTEAEARARIRELRPYADLNLVWIAEVGDEPAGLAAAVPLVGLDEDGSALSLKRMLSTLRGALSHNHVSHVHVVTIAVDPEHRPLHIGAQLILRVWRAALDLGVLEAELSGIDAGDQHMQHMLWRLGCRRNRHFAVLESTL